MSIAFRVSDTNIFIKKSQHAKALAELHKNELISLEIKTLEAALNSLHWFCQKEAKGLKIEIDKDSLNHYFVRECEILAPFISKGSFVRFVSEENENDYALCVFDGQQAIGFGWLDFRPRKDPLLGALPTGKDHELLYDETPSPEKLQDYRYWAIVAMQLARTIGALIRNHAPVKTEQSEQVNTLLRYCQDAIEKLEGKGEIKNKDLTEFSPSLVSTAKWLKEDARKIQERFRSGLSRYFSKLPGDIEITTNEIDQLLAFRPIFSDSTRNMLSGNPRGIYPRYLPDIEEFIEWIGTTRWFNHKLTANDPRVKSLLIHAKEIIPNASANELLNILCAWKLDADEDSATYSTVCCIRFDGTIHNCSIKINPILDRLEALQKH